MGSPRGKISRDEKGQAQYQADLAVTVADVPHRTLRSQESKVEHPT